MADRTDERRRQSAGARPCGPERRNLAEQCGVSAGLAVYRSWCGCGVRNGRRGEPVLRQSPTGFRAIEGARERGIALPDRTLTALQLRRGSARAARRRRRLSAHCDDCLLYRLTSQAIRCVSVLGVPQQRPAMDPASSAHAALWARYAPYPPQQSAAAYPHPCLVGNPGVYPQFGSSVVGAAQGYTSKCLDDLGGAGRSGGDGFVRR